MKDETVKITGTATGSHAGDQGPYRIDLTATLGLRDLFAAFAITGLASSDPRDARFHAANAYGLADAMLAQRAESKRSS